MFIVEIALMSGVDTIVGVTVALLLPYDLEFVVACLDSLPFIQTYIQTNLLKVHT